MKLSKVGALVGAIVGAAARSAVVVFHLQGAVWDMPALLLPSAGIGLLVGAIAGATGWPARGAVIGAILSGVVFELFMMPLVSLIGLFSAEAGADFFGGTLPYALQMALAGAIAGAAGGAAEQLQQSQTRGDSADMPPRDAGK